MENIDSILKFEPLRLDWTVPNVKRQILYSAGHHVGNIKINEDGSLQKDCDTYKIVKYLLENRYCPQVKKVTWKDIKESGFIHLESFSLDHQASTYLKYVPEYYTGGMNMGRMDSEGNLVEQIDKEKGFDDIGSSFYHGCKGHWLLHDIKKNGLNQPIQGVISKVEHDDYYALHIHPGSVRQGVFGALDDETMEMVVWDAFNAFDWVEPLEIDEWLEIFARPQFLATRPTDLTVNYSYTNIEIQCHGMQGKKEDYEWRNEVVNFSKRVMELSKGKPLNVYIGYDSRHNDIHKVQIESHLQAFKKRVREEDFCFIPEFKLLDKASITEYTREYANQSTEFTYSRFLIPYLENYEGFSMFIDNDFIWKQPFWEMFYFLHPDNAVACVQYDYELEKMSKVKMGGEKNVMYPKKLWSSLMIFNNAHEDCKKLTPEVINTATGQYLHQFEWTDSIDRIPDKYILTEGMSDDEKRYHAVHYTRGGPWIADMDTSEIKHLNVYEDFCDK
jgi:hypothetical protein